jgi:translation initiation factor eIF-2B subunit delta
MGNAIKEIKTLISHFTPGTSESEAKRILNEEIDMFIHEKIKLAAETICKYILANSEIVITGSSYARSKITNDDCILTYGYSSLVLDILLKARRSFPSMQVVVVDSRPKLRGRKMLNELVRHGVACTYVLLNGVSFIMNRVTKVILGAHALLANGYVMSPIGSSQIALVAKSFNVPVVGKM